MDNAGANFRFAVILHPQFVMSSAFSNTATVHSRIIRLMIILRKKSICSGYRQFMDLEDRNKDCICVIGCCCSTARTALHGSSSGMAITVEQRRSW